MINKIIKGNKLRVNSSRCAIDAMKYCRNYKREEKDLIEEEKVSFKDSDCLKLKRFKKYNLENGYTLILFPNIPEWLIIGNSMIHNLNSLLEEKRFFEIKVDEAFLSLLYNKGVLYFNQRLKNVPFFSGRYMARSDNSAMLTLTNRCNLRCAHCVASANQKQFQKELVTGDYKKVIDQVASQENPLNVEKKIFLTGGEPLLKRESLIELIKYACSKNLSVHVCTNGLLLDDSFIKEIKEFPVAFSISLDGNKEMHEKIRGVNTYRRTINTINLIKKYNKDLFINTFSHMGVLDQIEDLVDLAVEKECNGINFIHIIERGIVRDANFKRIPDKILFRKIYEIMKKSRKHYEILLNENLFPNLACAILAGARNLNCGLSRDNYFFLESNGDVYPCPGTKCDEFKLGSILRSSLKEILTKRESHFLPKLRVNDFPICKKCDFKFFCGGDCRGTAYECSNKDIEAPIPYCIQRKDSLIELFRIISEDPNFFKEKVNYFIRNSLEETEYYKKKKSILIVTPSEPITQIPNKKELIDIAKSFLMDDGWNVSFSKNFSQENISYEEKARDINEAFKDPFITSIIASQGGYDSIGLLPYLDFEAIKSNPKPFFGISDITILLNAIWAKSNILTYHGLDFMWGLGKNIKTFTKQSLNQIFEEKYSLNDFKFKNIKEGKGEGIILGGCLSSFSSLIKTQWNPLLREEGFILFLESTELSLESIKKLLLDLRSNNNFKNCKGLILGKFYSDKDISDEVTNFIIKSFSIENFPILQSDKIGHFVENIIMPIGQKIIIEGDFIHH